jgi:hypothetical protein
MYVVLDTKQLPTQLTSRFHAENLKAQLVIDNPEADWAIFVQACPMDANVLENLYALAALLLESSKLNPFKAELAIAGIDGQITNHSILSIMNTSRLFLDQTEVN